MNRTATLFLRSCLLCLVACMFAAPAMAQTVTTGTLTGVVRDSQGGVLPGATVLSTHAATGTVYQSVAQTDGRFLVLNVRVGAYTIKVTMPGFGDADTGRRRSRPG